MPECPRATPLPLPLSPTMASSRTNKSPYAMSTRRAPQSAEPAFSPQTMKVLFIFLIAIIVFVPAMQAGFIWDDDQLLTANPMMRDPWGLLKLWFAPTTADYFPLTSSTLWIEWRLWELSGPGYHVTNIILHAFDSVLVMIVLQRLRIPGAWLAATLWAVHPVNAESVAWISERKNTLSMLFYLYAILAYLDFEDRPANKTRWYVLALVLYFAALTSKTSVVTFPVVLLLIAWWRRGEVAKNDLVRTAPFFGLSVLLGIVTLYFQYGRAIGSENIAIGGFFSRLAGAGMAVWFYLGKTLAPFNLIEIYPHWDIDPPEAWQFLPGIGLVLIFFVLWKARDGWGRAPLFALSYFVITLGPVLGFLKMSYMRLTLVADHFQYVPMIGILALLAAGFTLLYERAPSNARPALVGACVLVIGGLSWMTWDRAGIHESEETLWRDTLEKNPDTWQGHNHLGAVLFTQGNVAEAMKHFQRAVELKPDNPEVHNNVGLGWATMGHMDLAVPEYAEAVRIRPDNIPIRTNYANALAAVHRTDEALAQYQEAIKMSDGMDPKLLFEYARMLFEAGRKDEGIAKLHELLKIAPNFAPAREVLQALKSGTTAPSPQ